MTALVVRTEPGPFGRRTVELGGCLGISDSDRLVAMSGRRVQLDPPEPGHEFVEVSLVGGDPAYLHVLTTNTAAIRLYDRLGFHPRVHTEAAIVTRAR